MNAIKLCGVLGGVLTCAGLAIALYVGEHGNQQEPNYNILPPLGVAGLGIILLFLFVVDPWCKEDKEATKKDEEAAKARHEWLGQWDLLREGMTESEVRSFLGAPAKIEPLFAMTGEMAAQWTYGRWPFKGIVRFHMGRLVGLEKPR